MSQNYCDDPKCPNRNPWDGLHYAAGHPMNKDNCSADTPPRPEGKLGLTEIHGPNGELVVMPESPLEITRRVNLHAQLVEALERAQNDIHSEYCGTKEWPTCNLIEALLKQAKEKAK